MQLIETYYNIEKAATSNKIEVLDLSYSKLDDISKRMANLSHLLSLEIKKTELSFLPVEIKYLYNLKKLILPKNNIKSLPPEIGALSNLEVLDLRYNNLSHLPPEIGNLSHLKELNLEGNKLSCLPEELGKLPKLTKLILNRNCLSELPGAICNLRNLQIIELERNQVKRLPEQIGNLIEIIHLNLNENKLDCLPSTIGKLVKVQELFAANNSLTTLPKNFSGLKSLMHLNLECNGLKKIPEETTKLPAVKRLKLCCNKFFDLPEEIGELRSLEKLYVSFNKLDRIPYSIGKLKNLKLLDLSGNKLTTIPPTIGRMIDLEVLELSENKINYLPPELGSLENIICIYLKQNQIESLPLTIGRLKCLTILDLDWNQLRSLPQEIGKVKNLSMLNVSNNKLEALPIPIGFMSKLEILRVGANNFKNIPEEIGRSGKAIQSYLRQLSKSDEKTIYEIKLLVVGDGRVGKTSLTKKILDPLYVVGEVEPSTEGIEVHKWSFQTENNKNYTVNIWDFGGQEIYYATHKFFLTKNSLYFIVVDPRKDKENFQYWLELVQHQGKKSPILIIKNEKGGEKIPINCEGLRGKFLSLKEVLATDLLTERGFNSIIRSLKYYAQSVVRDGVTWPNSWRKVRQALENHYAHYISLKEYFNICDQHGVINDEDKSILSSYLHEVGVCLHFQEDYFLNKILILNPEWGTDAVYKIFNAEKVIENFGRFYKEDLRDIWSEYKFENKHGELLQLMKNFQLCYELNESPGEYLAPTLLSEVRPSYKIPNDDSYRFFLIKYQFMPKGILSKFIVAMSHYIEKQDLVWKYGVIVNNETSTAEITEDYNGKNVKIKITGKNNSKLFHIIEHEIDRINRSYSLAVAKFIACTCIECHNLEKLQFYNLEKLRNRLIEGIETVTCKNSNLTLFIHDLLMRKPIKTESDFGSKLEKNMGHSININSGGGDVAISFNKANAKIFKSIEKASDPNLQQDLTALTSKISEMLNTKDFNNKDNINADLKLFVSEAVKEQPKKRWLEISGKSLIEAATKAGEIGKPIIDLVGSILKNMPQMV